MAENPDGGITFRPEPKRLCVVFNGQTIADSADTLVLEEPGHTEVHYFPPADVRMNFLKPTDHHSHCPYKGDASYWTIEAGCETAENAVWSYPAPFDAVSEISGYMSFYTDRVSILVGEGED